MKMEILYNYFISLILYSMSTENITNSNVIQTQGVVQDGNANSLVKSNDKQLFTDLLTRLKANIVLISDNDKKYNKIKEYISELDNLKSELDNLKSKKGFFSWLTGTGGKTNKNKLRKNKTKKMKQKK